MTIAAADSTLFKPIKIGNVELKHRVVLAPLTRLRNDIDTRAPVDLVKEYYLQRTTPGGLLIAEATAISPSAVSYKCLPGIYSREQLDAWKDITTAVHAAGGYIYSQIWHAGRATSTKLLPQGVPLVSASAIAIKGKNMCGDDYETPQELTKEQIKSIIQDFAEAAKKSMEAGFDGVEIHGANGYLIDQFINTSSNKRTDEYGGSIENRARFCLEVVDAVVKAVGENVTAVRLSPWSEFQDMEDETPYETWGYIVQQLQERHPNLSYIHFIEPRDDFGRINKNDTVNTLDPFRKIWKGPFISAGGYTTHPELAAKVADETGNLIAIGRAFIANPDLPLRLKNGWPLNKYDRSSFYGGTHVGYTDYPFYEASKAE